MPDDSIPTFLSLTPTRRRTPKPTPARTTPQLAFTLFPPEPPVPHSSTVSPSMSGSTPNTSSKPTQPAEPILYTVRQLINELRQHLEHAYTGILNVEGEISNCRPAASGHIYFTLKDGEAQLPVVLFRGKAQLLAFKPRDGAAVEVRGRISVYESRGQLQLIVESLRPRGTGALQFAFEQLRDRLRAEGLFDRPRTPLPPFPHCIGIVTSPSGAALRDIINVIRRRHARLNLLIYPALTQGPQSPAQISAGIRFFNHIVDQPKQSVPHSSTASPSMSGSTPRSIPCVDLILIARGGGSLEDLAAFNDESLARTIASSRLPVVSAIGHEIDHTIADFVADLRAPTPSAAAELITAAQHRIEERVLSLAHRLPRAAEFHLLRARQRLARLSAAHVLARLRDTVSLRHQRIDDLRQRLQAALLAGQTRRQRTRTTQLTALEARLRRHDPTVRLTLSSRRLATLAASLDRLAATIPTRRRTALAQATLRLQALSPLAVLNRGYAIVYAADGTILRNPTEAPPDSLIQARLAQGTLQARVIPQRHLANGVE